MSHRVKGDETPAPVDEHEAARIIGMSVAFLRADRYRGHVGARTAGPPFLRLGRAIRYDPLDLKEWLSEHRVVRSQGSERGQPQEVA